MRHKALRCSIIIAAGLFLAVFFGLAYKNTPETDAVKATDFKAGRIIDDAVFYNPNTMTVAEIQAHLDRYSANCDMWGEQPIGYGRKINGVAVNPNISRREYARMMREAGRTDYHDAPYVCISKYYENPTTHKTNFETNAVAEEGMISAAQIIYDAAHAYNINPQVLLVMLKKESYVWGDTWPLKNEYNTVMGYACPDNAPCDSVYFGFYNQVMKAAWQLNYYKEHIYSYGYYPYMTNNIYYSPNYSCGTKSVYLENIATTSLYIYTPYTPNDAALANYPGEAYCGSYGNRNFFMYFSEWFGSTYANTPEVEIANYYNSSEELKNKLGQKVGDLKENKSTGIYWQEYENGFILGNSITGYYESMGGIRSVWQASGFEGGKYGFPISKIFYTENGISWQKYQNGIIIGSDETGYYESNAGINVVWQKNISLGAPLTDIINDSNNNLTYQEYQNGMVISGNQNNYYVTIKEIFNTSLSLKEAGTDLGKMTANYGSNTSTGITWQSYENGLIVGSADTGFYESSGEIRKIWQKNGFEGGALGFPTSKIIEDTTNQIFYQKYQNGIIIGGKDKVYRTISGKLYVEWEKIKDKIGYPIDQAGSNASTGITWQTFQNGLIVGSNKTGYYESRGSIRNAWQQSGFESGKLGFPTSNIIVDEENDISYQEYQGGIIILTKENKTFITKNEIFSKWLNNYKSGLSLGMFTANYGENKSTNIVWQSFQNGLIVGSIKTGFFESRGKIRSVWQKYNFESGKLGFPTSDIISNTEKNITYQKYQGGIIVSAGGKEYITTSGILDAWLDNDLGVFMDNYGENKETGISWQAFQNGLIVGSNKTGFFESRGKIRDFWQKKGFESGQLGFPLSNITTDGNNTVRQKYQGGTVVCSTSCTIE